MDTATDITTDLSSIESTSTVPIEVTTINYTLVTDDPGKGSLILNETITDLNVTTTEYIPIVAAATAFASLIAIGLFAVSIFIVVLIRGRKRFQEFPFFAIVYHLTAANAIHILLQLTTVLPIMLLDSDEDSANLYWYKVGSYGIMITEQASLYFTLLMTINRFAVFVCPIFHSVIYFSPYHHARDVLCHFHFYNEKRKIVDSQNQKKADRDTSLVVQALIITIALEMVNITDVLTPLFKTAQLSLQWIWTIFCYCVTIFNQLVNPLFFLMVNKMVRSVAKHIFDKNISSFLSDTSSTNKLPGW
uniref:G_PROTEIN_RECEP_F1_2 domain-containing protein n=1 Tax=Caenorhabditis tropicalis TaxID=1561998 RepID=A0A1I7TA60_9PELO